VGNEKIAALGFHLARRISTHGFALNLGTDLAGFDAIVPCGIANRGVTSVEKVLGRSPSLSEVAPRVAASLAETFHRELVEGLPAAGQSQEFRYGFGVAATA
jgi:lipoyl(octanoyl) transferase